MRQLTNDEHEQFRLNANMAYLNDMAYLNEAKSCHP